MSARARSAPLFVYGTLLSGESSSMLLGERPRRPATVRGLLYALPAGYPALVPGGREVVHGELVDDVDDAILGLLDAYEGVGEGLYERVRLDARFGLRAVEAWAYVMDAARARAGRRLASGRWRPIRRRGSVAD